MTKDIVERLREASGYALMDNARVTVLEAADEIADLRFALRQATDRASLAEVKGSQLLEAGRLTDAERYAVRYMIAAGKFGQRDEALTEEHAATLRGLLERLR